MNLLLLNQCFWPDVVATAQQLTRLAQGLTARGHKVTVVAARRGYDDLHLLFPAHEKWQGIDIIRVNSISLGKKSRWRRALNFGSFMLACALRLAFLPRQDVVIALTSPPLISCLGAAFTRLRGGRMVFWVMDLNPDEAIAAGWLKPKSFIARVLDRLLLGSMRQAEKIVALDRFTKDRIVAKGIPESKVLVMPPAGDDSVQFDRQGREEFRRLHELTEKFVVMYAGNHSPCHPLETLLQAAAELSARPEIVFLFVGGGSEMVRVKAFAEAQQLENIRCLKYQPQEDLAAVLSAADLHAIVLGERFTGIVHPSKIYNIMGVQSPFIYIGPSESHVSDIIGWLGQDGIAMTAAHGEAREVARQISEFVGRGCPRPEIKFADDFSAGNLVPQLIAQIELLGPEAVSGIASRPSWTLPQGTKTIHE